MTTEAIKPISATPFAGVLPWLGSILRSLRAAVDTSTATREEAQVLHLIEYVAGYFGDPLLQATDLDDLDDRLDDLVASSKAVHCTALLVQYAAFFQRFEPISANDFALAAETSLGSAQMKLLSEHQEMMDVWLAAQRQATEAVVNEPPEASERIFDLTVASPQIPVELAEFLAHSLRAGFCSLAITRAIATNTKVEAWLAHALTLRLIASAKQHLRLLASLDDVTVPESIVPRAERLDFGELVEHHRRARRAAYKALEQTRTRLGL